MDDKLLAKMDEHLENTRWDIRAALQRFEESGLKIGRRFRKLFIKQTTDCVIDTCEKFWNEKSGGKDGELYRTLIIDSRDHGSKQKCSPIAVKREHEHCADEESAKRRKTFDVTDSTVDIQPKLEHPMFFFYCIHCLNANEAGEAIGGSITDVYQHWQSSHATQLTPKPFRFYVAQIAVCQFGDAIGTYRELQKHQQQMHADQPLAIVSYQDQHKCGICLRSTYAIGDHFRNKHQAGVDVFNPMRFSNEQLDSLLLIETHKRRQCGHCDVVFETEDEIDIHHSIGHEGAPKISKQYIDTHDPFLLCGYCHLRVAREEYLSHFQAHSYTFKCWKCSYQSNDLIVLVIHDKHLHDKDTLDYHCSMFSDWLRRHFDNTKIEFPNGLVLKTYNLRGSRYDDSQIFDGFIANVVEDFKQRYIRVCQSGDANELLHDINGTMCPAEDPSFLYHELNKQNELANNLLVLRMPRMNTIDLRDMFLKLCDKLNVKVTAEDVQHIKRRGVIAEGADGREGKDDIVVCLKRFDLKEEIRYAAQKKTISSGDLFELPPSHWPKPIKVISHTTRYYSDMMSIAKDARASRIIYHYELTHHGILIKRSATSDTRTFISKSELQAFINRLKL